jgi:hypothetical protein
MMRNSGGMDIDDDMFVLGFRSAKRKRIGRTLRRRSNVGKWRS